MNSEAGVKHSAKPVFDSPELINFPTFLFKDRALSVLEIIVEFLVVKKKLSYHEIAVLLNRDERTIWTVYRRVKDKRKK